MIGALHVSSNVFFIASNPVSNLYHKYTFLGKSYSAWSSGQLLQIDYIKTHLRAKFDSTKIIDQNKRVDPIKFKNYAKNNDFDVKIFMDLAASKPKNT
jgi:hypothetical protein